MDAESLSVWRVSSPNGRHRWEGRQGRACRVQRVHAKRLSTTVINWDRIVKFRWRQLTLFSGVLCVLFVSPTRACGKDSLWRSFCAGTASREVGLATRLD